MRQAHGDSMRLSYSGGVKGSSWPQNAAWSAATATATATAANSIKNLPLKLK